MDPRERADATLARARARGAFVVTPESAVSPMDAASTLQIPRTIVTANDDHHPDGDATIVVPGAVARGLPRQTVRAEENIPAIAQEAMTDVVNAPPGGMRTRQQRIEDAERVRRSRAELSPSSSAEQQQTEELEGLVPTTKPSPAPRSTLSQRLDG